MWRFSCFYSSAFGLKLILLSISLLCKVLLTLILAFLQFLHLEVCSFSLIRIQLWSCWCFSSSSLIVKPEFTPSPVQIESSLSPLFCYSPNNFSPFLPLLLLFVIFYFQLIFCCFSTQPFQSCLISIKVRYSPHSSFTLYVIPVNEVICLLELLLI